MERERERERERPAYATLVRVVASKTELGFNEKHTSPLLSIAKRHCIKDKEVGRLCTLRVRACSVLWGEDYLTGDWYGTISFPEPTCPLVSGKTRSSGKIHFKSPRFWDFQFHGACVSWFKTWCLEIKSMWMRIECLCGTNPHRFYLWTPFLSQGTHAPWNRKSKNLGLLKMDYSRAPCLGADQRTRGLWERDCVGARLKVSRSEVTCNVHFYWAKPRFTSVMGSSSL